MRRIAGSSHFLRYLLLTGGLALILTIAARHVLFGPAILESGDLAVNALQIENAKAGQELYGNYSRFQFHHPGPAFFYAYAGGERLLFDGARIVASPHQAHLWTGILLQAAFGAAALTILARRLPSPLGMALLAAVAGAYFGWTGTVFTSLWPPYVLAMPFLCFLAACVSAASGYSRDGVMAIVAGGFLVHGHVAQALLVGGLGLVTLALIGWQRGIGKLLPPTADETAGGTAGNRWRRWHWLLAIFLVGAFLLPLMLDLVRHGLTGNTATIVRRFVTNTEDAKSLQQAVLYFASFATPTHDQDILLQEIGPATWSFFAAQRGWLLGWLLVFLCAPVLLVLLWPRLETPERRFALTAAVLWLVAVALCVAWGTAQAGPMFHYNGAFFISVYAFPLLLVVLAMARLLPNRPSVWVAPALYAAAAVVLLLRLTLPSPNADIAGEPVRRAVAHALAASSNDRPKVLLFDAEQWPVAAAVALALERSSQPWYTMARWNFMFQDRHDLARLGANAPFEADLWRLDTRGDDADGPSPSVTIEPLPASVVPGRTVISHRDNVDAFAFAGLEVTKPAPVWTVAADAVLVLRPEPTETDVRVIFDAAVNERIPAGPAEQPAVIFFNGIRVGEVSVGTRTEVAVVVPRALWNRQERATLTLHFPLAVPDDSFTRPRAHDAYAWALWNIHFEAIR